jgi:hypothetical protein
MVLVLIGAFLDAAPHRNRGAKKASASFRLLARDARVTTLAGVGSHPRARVSGTTTITGSQDFDAPSGVVDEL